MHILCKVHNITVERSLIQPIRSQCSRKRMKQLKKPLKRKKPTYNFTGHLITQPLILKVGTGKSPTSNILFGNEF